MINIEEDQSFRMRVFWFFMVIVLAIVLFFQDLKNKITESKMNRKFLVWIMLIVIVFASSLMLDQVKKDIAKRDSEVTNGLNVLAENRLNLLVSETVNGTSCDSVCQQGRDADRILYVGKYEWIGEVVAKGPDECNGDRDVCFNICSKEGAYEYWKTVPEDNAVLSEPGVTKEAYKSNVVEGVCYAVLERYK